MRDSGPKRFSPATARMMASYSPLSGSCRRCCAGERSTRSGGVSQLALRRKLIRTILPPARIQTTAKGYKASRSSRQMVTIPQTLRELTGTSSTNERQHRRDLRARLSLSQPFSCLLSPAAYQESISPRVTIGTIQRPGLMARHQRSFDVPLSAASRVAI